MVGINCSLSLDVMPVHITLYGGAQTSVCKENAYWNIWLAQILIFLYKSNKPTFIISKRKVIGLKLGTDKIGDLVTNWHVSDVISLPNPSVPWASPGT